MDTEDVRARFDRQMRREAPADGPGAVVERVGAVVRQTVGGPGAAPEGGWNGVLWSALDADSADAAIAGQIRHFASLGLEFEWKLYSYDGPADLAGRLLAAGFTPEPPETLMIAETAGLPGHVPLPDGVRLVAVTDAAGVELMAEVHERAFGEDRAHTRERLLGQLAAAPGSVAAVVALAGDTPVSAARMELPPGTDFAGLWGGGTVPGWRGRGLYRALVAFRTRLAAERGYRYLQVDASRESRPILRRLGFAELATTTPYVRAP
ncbi:GNAT family N-acetyltransferase [Streptomyces sp. NBC_01498]|uniref:GNAT family N-acetyltransferase n=1 Tax=Streptomyces sp. NBC_01498 TaxID=2975870 RepID=UPI002E7B8CB1|nr:GNAT family N-acetyltransferase [Streptomyces sp. NBC_01498]WTL28321.1 GNAT family N-acetyltransferase [Streptomyces sp. NBC_01498]